MKVGKSSYTIYQEDLDRFLAVAQRLKLEGLLEGKQEEEDTEHQEMPSQKPETIDPHPLTTNKLDQKIQRRTTASKFEGSNNMISLNTSQNDEIDATLNENLEVLDGGHFRCRICGQDSLNMKRNARQNMKNHVERHVEGLTYNCQLCEKEFRSRHSLNTHISKIHKNKF